MKAIRSILSALVLTALTAFAAPDPCDAQCKNTVKDCTEQCIKTQPKSKSGDCKKACAITEQPCKEDCKKHK